MKWTEIATALIAAYGAILSTITFVIHIWQSRPRLKVVIQESVVFTGTGLKTPTVVLVKPSNHGKKAVNLVGLYFEFPDKKKIVIPRPLGLPTEFNFPHELQPEHYCTMWIEAKGLAQALREQGFTGKVEVRAVLWDAVDRQYKSKWVEFDSDKYRNDSENQ